MKIILLQTYENVGNVGEIVKVKNGFARNFLIPNKIAAPATDKNINELKVYLKAQEVKEAKNRTNMDALNKQLSKVTIKLELQAGEDDKLFGSVTTQMISDSLNEKGYKVDKKYIAVDETIKALGNYSAIVDFGDDISAKVKLKVIAE